MAISIDPITYVIHVPKADLGLIQVSPEVRELDLDTFRLALKDLEDDPNYGIFLLKTHNHNTEINLSGITYARLIEILDPYTVEFEDGQYTVSCTGANHNLADVRVANQVSLIINNSAGLVHNYTTQDISDSVFNSLLSDYITPGTYGAELATKADLFASANSSETSMTSGVITYGDADGGTYSDAASRDDVYWMVGEDATNGITVDMTFYLPGTNKAGTFNVFGRYTGSPATTHHQELWAWNYETGSWEELSDEFMPGGITADDTFRHEYYERHIDRDNSNEVKIRIKHHVTTYNASHVLYLDHVYITSIEVITASALADAVWSHTDAILLHKYMTNKKILLKEGSVWYLIIYDDDNVSLLIKKAVKDKDGNDITDLAAGTLAQEIKSIV